MVETSKIPYSPTVSGSFLTFPFTSAARYPVHLEIIDLAYYPLNVFRSPTKLMSSV
jgi:hypothetical protein